MNELTISQGDSATIAIVLPSDRMDKLEDFVVTIGQSFKYQFSNNDFKTTVENNVFLLELSSYRTMALMGIKSVVMAIDYSDLGIRKYNNSFTINVLPSSNTFSNDSISDVIDATITYTIVENEVNADIQIASILKGDTGDPGPEGPEGPQGFTGPPGFDGLDGKTILNGVIDPTTEGVDGDFYINTITNEIFGPKEAGTWGSGTSLIGPQGPPGDTSTEINDLTTSVTWANIPDGNVPESAVTQHEEALSIGWSQVTSKPFIPNVDDTAYDSTSWNTNIDAPTKNAVRDKIESMDSAISSNTAKISFPGFTSLLIDYGFTDNSSNWDTAYGWGNHALENYLIEGDINTLDNINAIITDATLITDAPSDGSTYGRNNGRWVTVSEGAAGDVYQVELAEGQFTDGDKTKLDGIEVGATANDQERDLNAQTVTNYILALTDANNSITMNNSAANTVTIPTNDSVAFPIGTTITVWMLGSGVTSITADTGVTLSGNGGTALAGSCDIQTQYNAAVLLKIDTNSWLVSGNISPVS